ncbi:MAG: hypothetical protein V3U98_04140 [Acidobacteriota bacterium]
MRLPAFCSVMILILCQGCLQAPPLVSSAWQEANRRAGTQAAEQPPPEVDWEGARGDSGGCLDPSRTGVNPPARYLPDLDRVEILSLCAQPLHVLLVHEFLHAIRQRARRQQGVPLAGQDFEEEAWVRERLSGS